VSTPELVRIRVLIVDDHPIARRGIAFGLQVFDDIQAIGEAASGEEAIRLCEILYPDVVLMEVNMPGTPAPDGAAARTGIDGITATQHLHECHPAVRVLILTHYADSTIIRAALAAGACGYLIKDVTLEELGQAIRMSYTGHTVLSQSATQALMQPAGRLDACMQVVFASAGHCGDVERTSCQYQEV
jgi:DNA-binding NarL/FixJ family response regulator